MRRWLATKNPSFTLEFQTRYDPNMPVRMLAYHIRIVERYGLPVYPIVVYLKQTDRPIETSYSSHARGKHISTFNYDVIKIWELKSKAVFRDELVGLFTLTPLMHDFFTKNRVKTALRVGSADIQS